MFIIQPRTNGHQCLSYWWAVINPVLMHTIISYVLLAEVMPGIVWAQLKRKNRKRINGQWDHLCLHHAVFVAWHRLMESCTRSVVATEPIPYKLDRNLRFRWFFWQMFRRVPERKHQ